MTAAPAELPRPHVFITRTDLTQLACDYWLLPGNTDYGGPGLTEANWLGHCDGLREQFDGGLLREPQPVAGNANLWKLQRIGTEGPQPYLLDTGGTPATDLDWYVCRLNSFADALKTEMLTEPRPRKRARALVGIPMIGTGGGGKRHVRGELVLAVLSALYDIVERLSVDVVLVAHDLGRFSAAQAARRKLAPERDVWRALTSTKLEAAAIDLAAKARAGRLVLFLGAGIGIGAGLPTWEGLLDELATRAGLSDEQRVAMSAELPAVDQAEILHRAFETQQRELTAEIVDVVKADRYSLTHTLLAALPVREAATTNYDELFEAACRASGEDVAQLPYSPSADHNRWVLKLHGTESHREDIVLTRGDYISYPARRAALAGIVQGLLITKHMLFIGFSLTDDNFHRIAHDVQTALRGTASGTTTRPFGTAVVLEPDALREKLWEGSVSFVPTGGRDEEVDVAALRLEIFLDKLLAEASPSSPHLLDRAYDEILTPDERALRDRLLLFLKEAEPENPSMVAAWSQVARLAIELGLPSSGLKQR